VEAGKNNEYREPKVCALASFGLPYRSSTESIREGRSVSPDIDLAVKRHQLVDMIQKASDTGIRQIL
jgi:hypothetical protein